MTKETKMGRPTSYLEEFAGQAQKLCALGATDAEIADFFALMPSEEDWLYACLLVIRQDRRGVFAAQKAARSRYRKKYVASNPNVRIREATRSRIWAALRGHSDGALFSRLPYSANDLVAHLEAHFSEGMSWANYGKWHVDHIRPCSLFDLANESEFKECWALSNLQPLWAGDNLKKGARYVSA